MDNSAPTIAHSDGSDGAQFDAKGCGESLRRAGRKAGRGVQNAPLLAEGKFKDRWTQREKSHTGPGCKRKKFQIISASGADGGNHPAPLRTKVLQLKDVCNCQSARGGVFLTEWSDLNQGCSDVPLHV